MKRVLGWILFVGMMITLTALEISGDTDNDQIEGTLTVKGFNNNPSFDAFNVVDRYGNQAFALSPQEPYTISFTIHDPDSVADFKSLELRLFYDDELDTETSFLNATGTDLSGEALVVRWGREDESVENSASLSDFDIVYVDGIDSSASTWDIVNSTTPAILADETKALSFTFEVTVLISKVAPQSATGLWRVGFIFEDGYFPNESPINTTTHAALRMDNLNPLAAPATGFNMDFFAQVSIPSNTQLAWPSVNAGDDFNETNVAQVNGITYISNGSFSQDSWTTDHWIITPPGADVPLGVTRASLASGSLDDPQTFGLQIQSSASGQSPQRLAPSINSQPQKTSVATSTLTDETGLTVDYTYAMALSDAFQNATYSGILFISVSNNFHQARIGEETYLTLDAALEAGKDDDTIDVFFSYEGDVELTRPLTLNLNGYRIIGNLSLVHTSSVDSVITGSGTITGDLIINTPNAALDSDANILGTTVIQAIKATSFNTFGTHGGGVRFDGPGRINASRPVNVDINTTEPVVLAGKVNALSVSIAQANLDFVGTVQSLAFRNNVEASTLSITIREGANLQQGFIQNTTQNKLYQTIQSALNAANIGDTIVVRPGVYEETLTLNVEGVTLQSLSGAALTTIRGGGGSAAQDAVVNFTADQVTLDGFTLDRGDELANSRIVAPRNSSGSSIVNNVFINGARGVQGNFYGTPQHLTVSDNTFEDSVLRAFVGTEDSKNIIFKDNLVQSPATGLGLGTGATVFDVSGNLFENTRGLTIRDNSTDLSVITGNTFIGSNSEGYVIQDVRTGGDSLETLLATNSFESTARFGILSGMNFAFIADINILENLAYNSTQKVFYTTIQAALDAADEGDTIRVGPGVYEEDLTFNTQSIELLGSNQGVAFDGDRLEETIISGGAIYFNQTDITFSGFYLLNTYIPRVNSNASGLSLKNTIIRQEVILEVFESLSTGDRYILKAQSGITDVTLEGIQIVGPGQNATVDNNPDHGNRLGGIDFNGVQDSVIRNVSINAVSRYGINIGGISSGIIIDGYQASKVGASNSFMAALYFANITNNAVTLKGEHSYNEVNLGVSLTGEIDIEGTSTTFFTTEDQVAVAEDFTLSISQSTIQGFGLSPTTDALAVELGFGFGYAVADSNIKLFFPFTFYSLVDVGETVTLDLSEELTQVVFIKTVLSP